MGIIRELSRSVIEKIAAGEVVERPASVVKELIENSIDAGARMIVVDLADGGKKRIAVIDDGCGMTSDDLAMCVRRHATSKISSEGDLWQVRSMGFRGEALAAIGAVSRMKIESKPNDQGIIEGAVVEIEGGELVKHSVAGSANGTKIVVSDLFYNVPARLKFMRSAAVEYGHIAECAISLALANPHLRFELIDGGKKKIVAAGVFDASDTKGMVARIASLIGDRYAASLAALCEDGAELSLWGFVAGEGRRGGKDIHIFLNGRSVKDRMLIHAVSSALGDGTMRERCPAAVLWLNIDPSAVDINVHPAKREVRFVNSGAVHDFVKAAVRKALSGALQSPCFKPAEACDDPGMAFLQKIVSPQTGEKFFEHTGSSIGAPGDNDSFKKSFSGASGGDFISKPEVVSKHASLPSSVGDVQCEACGVENSLRTIGQLGLAYVLCEDADGSFVIVDQHAAHERLGFEELKKGYGKGDIPGQRLLLPERIELSPRDFGYISENLQLFEAAGFELEPFGGTSIVVKMVPALLSGMELSEIFEKFASELEIFGTANSVDEMIDRIFAVIACHARVRSGDRLGTEELCSLVKDVERLGVTHCPHGRPALVRFAPTEIARWFKRD